MKRFTLSISAISITSLGLLLASACSTDDTTSDGEGGYVGSGGNTYMNRGGGTGYGGATGNGGAVGVGGKAATGGAVGVGGKAATGGAANGGAATGGKAATGGAATAGNAGNGGTAGAATAGNAGDGGTAGSTSTGGAATAGNAGRIGTAGSTSTAGKPSVAGSTSSGGTSNAGTAGKTNTGTAGTAGTLGDCGTVATSLALYCAPPTTVALPNTSTVATRDPQSDPAMGTLKYHIYNGAAQLYGTVAAAGAFWQGTPFTDATCSGAGVNATGKTGMTVTVVNNVATPVSVQLIVLDQAGTTAPYPAVTMTATVNVAGSAASTQTIPFSSFVPSCTLPSGASLNYATIRQIGFGFGAAGAVDVTLSNISFTSS